MSERLPRLDAWRGAAVWGMLVYHLLFDCVIFGWMRYETMLSWPLMLLERAVAWSFILCAGISAELTRSNLRRGLVTLAAGGLVTAVSYLIGAPILFGVLQFLGMAMLIYAAAGRVLRRLPARAEPFLWLALYVGSALWTERVAVQARWLFWLGFRYEGFTSFDYFPLLPYVFLFFLGAWAGRSLLARTELRGAFAGPAPGVLTWPGRRALIVYLLHQPVLFGACWLIHRLG